MAHPDPTISSAALATKHCAREDVPVPPFAYQTLRSEMMRRMNDGWDVDGERTSTQMTMRHVIPPPVWRMGLELINPLAWLIGGPTWTVEYRTLTVWIDEDGRLHRRTTGEIPRGWPQHHTWEVPDGPV